MLEDDYGVDWEVGREERTEVDHPHRAPLQGRAAAARRARRRPGQPAPAVHLCLSPLEPPAHPVGRVRPQRQIERERGEADASAPPVAPAG
ncbi:MAG: hypothetical protein H0X28_05410 [Solirubrobacterales bacterium]|nr:hypothetical protein [Solirubrobacterales bacterium]